MKLGDLVVRKSYGGDVMFRIAAMRADQAIIKGTDFRLLADSPLQDLVKVTNTISIHSKEKQARIKSMESTRLMEQYRKGQTERSQAELNRKLMNHQPFFEVPGKVLHLDGDVNYLKKSMELYGQLRVPAEGHYVNEANMGDMLYHLLPRVRPDIVVITGHDGVLKHLKNRDLYSLNSYKNSENFVKAVRIARQYERNFDALNIIAGACQSHFEALLQAGANFASSPGRILIHALDPVYIAVKSSFTPIKDTIDVVDVIQHTISGTDGLGGIETRGSYRIGIPRIKDLSTLNVTPSAT
ncbi:MULTISPECIES: sporulation peptidase YabG [unclassified Paenibacillus]|uniref:sporulation peptidase YabG n=1 Tax=unclassified Paenibacillus TaxID=185978 RepID=UPI001C0F4C9F|nr:MULTISPECIES: sporulation peptidase YabG [unclassified Paenibacillus]MBU5444145.1 sporulation peptidase YabG [Paenibacillus sp. MSJ-34]CAH0121981.1 Sporulation-specific protease YabG [Paenibacillus sp. CECT 9249]